MCEAIANKCQKSSFVVQEAAFLNTLRCVVMLDLSCF
jgi:hypothetical protein